MRVGQLSRVLYVLGAGAAPAVGDVLRDRPVKKKRVLLDNPQQPAIAFNRDVAKVRSIQQNRPGGWVIEPRNQVAERRFPRSARANQRRSPAPAERPD